MYWQIICIFLLLRPVDIESLSSNSSSNSSEDDGQKDYPVGWMIDDDFSDVNTTCPKCTFEHCQKKNCSDSGEEKYIVCFFTNWAWYRSGQASFRPQNINASLCTHIVYAFTSLNSSFLMTSSDSWADIDNKFYDLVTAFKKLGLKILISIGGWNNSAGLYWSTMINNDTLRARFVSTTKEFLKKYNFDGIDFDYEYPACPQGNTTAVNSTDKYMFNQLVREMKCELKDDYLMTASTAAGKPLIENCYDLKELCSLLDWVHIMTYDYHSYLDGETGANAPFCGSGTAWGVVDTIEYYRKELKCPANKMVMGIPFYGKSYTLPSNSSKHTFGTAVIGAGDAGKYTAAAGTLSYYEVCLLQNSGWTTGFNRVNGSYIYKGNQFVSIDTNISMVIKSCLIKKYQLLGAVIYALDYDDFNNMCKFGSYPLLKTLNHHLRCLNATVDN